MLVRGTAAINGIVAMIHVADVGGSAVGGGDLRQKAELRQCQPERRQTDVEEGADQALALQPVAVGDCRPDDDVMVLDLVMPDVDGMAVLETMARENLTTPVIVQTASSSLETVVTAMRHGASDFFVKPVAPERLIVSLRNAVKLDELETIVRTDRARRAGTFSVADIVTCAPVRERV